MYIPDNLDNLSSQDCVDVARVLSMGGRYKDIVVYLEAAIMKDDSVLGRFLLAGAYSVLPEELTKEDRKQIEDMRKALGKKPSYPEEIYLTKNRQERGLLHLLDYKMRGGVPEIDKTFAPEMIGVNLIKCGPGLPIYHDVPIWNIIFKNTRDIMEKADMLYTNMEEKKEQL